jgi:hypothetical protein
MRRIGTAMFGLVLVTTPATPLVGQRSALREVHDRGSFGINVLAAQSYGEFARNGNMAFDDLAYGVALAGVTSASFLGLRIEASLMSYDRGRQSQSFSTNSYIGTLAIGPQLTLSLGPHKLYGFGIAGGSVFWSSASYDRGCSCSYSDYLDGHGTTTAQAGAGVMFGLSSRVRLDLGAREVFHNRVKYVPAGGFSQNPDGSVSADLVESFVQMRMLQAGVSFAIR